MAIGFACPSCGKRFKVPDEMAGKRAKCTGCHAALTIPAAKPAPARHHTVPPQLRENWAAAGSESPTPQGSVIDVAATPAGAMVIPGHEPGSSLPPMLRRWEPWIALGRQAIVRYCPRRWWIWALVAVVGVLLVGLLHESMARMVLIGYAGAGLALIAVAIVWGVVVGMLHGSRKVAGALLTSPLWILLFVVGKLGRLMQNAEHKPNPILSPAHIAIAVGAIIAFGLLIAGGISNPKAFKHPFRVALMGLLLLALCWIPYTYHAASRNPLGNFGVRYAQHSAAPAWQHPTYRPPSGPPHRPPAEPTRPALGNRPQGMTSTRTPGVADSGSLHQDKGEYVEVKWGDAWWEARVLEQERDWTKVQYTSDHTREWVEPWRIRLPGSGVDDIPSAPPNRTWKDADGRAPFERPEPKPASQ